MSTTSDLLHQINRQHATSFLLLDRYARGEQGAFALSDAADERFVLKWAPRPSELPRFVRARHVTDRLRARGYPAPQYVLVSCTADADYDRILAADKALRRGKKPGQPLANTADLFTVSSEPEQDEALEPAHPLREALVLS